MYRTSTQCVWQPMGARLLIIGQQGTISRIIIRVPRIIKRLTVTIASIQITIEAEAEAVAEIAAVTAEVTEAATEAVNAEERK